VQVASSEGSSFGLLIHVDTSMDMYG
jgi:hypothetical protein